MKIGIQPTPIGFTNHWIKYCEDNKIPYKIIDCYRNDVIEQLEDCDAFMWNHDLLLSKDNILAKRILFAVEHSGKITFPKFEEGWHYDDKIAQKFLLESIKAPLVPSFLFTNLNKALEWSGQTNYPKVFKLKGGAGSSNVKLIKSKREAVKVINKSFKKGHKPVNKDYFFEEALRRYKQKEIGSISFLKSMVKYFLPVRKEFLQVKEQGYVYFQEFIPNNDNDYRIVVIDKNKAFGIKRYNRKDDFRASGSGKIEYLDESNCPKDCLKIAFDVAKKLNMDSIAYDFIYDKDKNPLIIEITFAFGSKASKASGYWDEDFKWHSEKIYMQQWMVENVMKRVKINN